MQLFESQSKNLFDFFNEPYAYYIPFYQRQYSWNTDNVTKLMDDIYDGVRTICQKEDYLRFIGAVILFAEANPLVNKHYDYSGLISNIFNVIDGQQRICTIAVIACLLSHKLKQIDKEFDSNGWVAVPTIPKLRNSIENAILELEEFYSIEVRKSEVEPRRKPIIIRALNQRESPVTDQWTLKGSQRDFYKSDVAALIANYISSGVINDDMANEKLKANIEEVRNWIDRTMVSQDFPSAEELLSDAYKGLKDFADKNINLAEIANADLNCYQLACGTIKLLAFIKFVTHRTYLTYIKCPSEDLAFDMFQSLNATGTPLTAIEVFKPLVVNTIEPEYGRSKAKAYFDEIDKYLDSLPEANNKPEYTDEILLHLGLIHDGTKDLGRRFSAQRDWLFKSFQNCNSLSKQEEFIEWVANLCCYWENIYKKRKPRSGTSNFELVKHFVDIGMTPSDADLASLCIFFLKDANHAMSHYVLAIFHGNLMRAKGSAKDNASKEFLKVAKACAAFYVYWQGTMEGFPDSIYRELFDQGTANLSNKSGKQNQNSKFLADHFLTSLENAKKKVFDRNDLNQSLRLWLQDAPIKLGYGRRSVCRFSLFLASDGSVPDQTTGNEGDIIKGRAGSSTYLTCERWYSPELEVLEHIANREMPKLPYKYLPPSGDLYPGDTSIVDRIGNLTLWSRSANSSTYPEWPDKCLYYASLTSLTPTTPVNINQLQQKLGAVAIPPNLQNIVNSSQYLPHLAPLVLKGLSGQLWDKAAVERRGENLCQHLFNVLIEWLMP